MVKNHWLYFVAEVALFLVFGVASLLGFAVGYFRKSVLIAAVIGLLFGFLNVGIAIFSNPLGALFGFAFGFNFGQYIVGIVFSVGFAVIGWWLGKTARGGKR